MTGVVLYLRASARTHPRRWVGLIALVGVVGGLVLGATAGARRTGSVVDRFVRFSRAGDVSIEWGPAAGYGELDAAKVARLPQVMEAHRAEIFFFRAHNERGRMITNADMGLAASPDVREFRVVDRMRLVSGRLPDPRRVNEVVTQQRAADGLGLRLGSTFDVRYATPRQLATGGPLADQSRYPFAGPRLTLKVVGVAASIPSTTSGGDTPQTLQSPALLRRYGHRIGAIPTMQVFLRHAATDLEPFKAEVERLAGPGGLQFFTTVDEQARRQRSIRIQAAALWLLAALAAVSALIFVGQALARLTLLDGADHSALVAMGMSRSQLVCIAVVRAGVIGLAAAPIAAAIAVGVSPWAPVGDLARALEPDPGLDADVLTLTSGTIALVLGCGLAALPSAWRAARVGAGAGRMIEPSDAASGVAERLARAGLPPTVVTGVRMGLEPGYGRAAIPARATLVGVSLATSMVALAMVFTASLHHLAHTPRLYGQAWDAQGGDGFGPDIAGEVNGLLSHHRSVAAYTLATFAEAQIDDRREGVVALDAVGGLVGPTVIRGRLPRAPGELLLATRTMADLQRRIGDDVRVGVGRRRSRLRIVGRGVIPDLSDSLRLGHGAVLSVQDLHRLQPHAPRNVVFIRFAAGVSAKRAIAALNRKVGPGGVHGGVQPVDLQSVGRVDATPLISAGMLGVIGLSTLAHALITAVRRRGRELAILKTLGFTRSQVRRVIAWQATTIAFVATVVGLPLGIAVGRLVWHAFSQQLGVVPEPVVPASSIVLAAATTLLLANVLAALPARAAARTAPAVVLRTE